MRSIFWIGCILVVLVSLLGSGAIADSMEKSTELAPVAAQDALVAENLTENLTENVTEVVTAEVAQVTAPVELPVNETVSPEVSEVTAPVSELNATVIPAEEPVAEPDLVKDTLVKFVTDARNAALISGKASALTAFSNPVGSFVTDKMYIFAYDYEGKVLAQPYYPGTVGQNQLGLSDSTGYRYVQQMRDLARSGFGFATYQDSDLMDKGAIKDKISYVADVDGTYWIGAGVFVTEEAPVQPIAAATPVETPVDVNATAPQDVTAPVAGASAITA
jgi:hypothetical protein